jgi:hypothetical protein
MEKSRWAKCFNCECRLRMTVFFLNLDITLYVTKDPGLTSVYKPKFGYLKSIETEIAYKDYTIDKEIKFDAS